MKKFNVYDKFNLSDINKQVLKQWEEGNAFIRDHGPEAFWEAFQRKPHYQAYKEE